MLLLKNRFDLIVLGAGSGGLAAAKRAANHGARVAIVEGDRIGGTCVIRGCVPKKLLVYGSQCDEFIMNSSAFGVEVDSSSIDSSVLLANVRKEVDRLNQIHIEMLLKSGVELIRGWGEFAGPNLISVKDSENSLIENQYYAEKILIAVGGKPQRPEIPGSSLGWVSDDMFLQQGFPSKVVIIGAGYIACEFACILNGLGVEVTQLVRGNCLLKGFDNELSYFLQKDMQRKGIDLQFNQSITSLEGAPGNINLKTKEDKYNINCEGVLFATGRSPFLDKLNLDKIGILTEGNHIKVNSSHATNIHDIFAIGDVSGRVNLTPVAIEEGRVLADNLFGSMDRKVNYDFIPKAVFSDPEIASVGISEEEAIKKFGLQNIKTFRSEFRPMSQSLQKSQRRCFLKLIVNRNTDHVLGCHMAGEHSAEIIQMASIAISMGAKKKDFDNTMALHPTVAEEFVTMK